jgi:UDPglucose 6-dehydrogenase
MAITTKFRIGVIGNGFVGESQAFAFAPVADVKIFDIDPTRATHTLEETLQQDYVFVCLPTPMKADGSQDLSLIENFFDGIQTLITMKKPIFILKSTVLPGTTAKLKAKHLNKIIFCPEFLTEKTAKLDMLTQARIVIGGDHLEAQMVKWLFTERFGDKHFVITDSTSAEIIKYMANNFLTVKTAFMNEYYDLAKELGADWAKVVEGFASDPRIGNSHTSVPGHDGKRGFGGTCFPKDINAIIDFSKEVGVDMNTLVAAWETNLRVRPEQDWKELKGRAVSEN